MATIVQEPLAPSAGDERFFLRGAIVMAVTIVTAFAFQKVMGRSTFAAPLRVHLHAFVFMGWVAIYLLQNIFVATDRMYLHRRLGWIAAAWMVPMIVMGFVVTIAMVRLGHVPFFFRPVQFLVFDPLSLLTFAGLTTSAILLRRRTEWHRRLHFCGMSMLLGPAFGRLLPMPLLHLWAWEAAFAATLLFPLAGAWADIRRSGRVHLPPQSTWNGRKVGLCDAGPEMTFHFGQLIAHIAKTRNVRAGSIVGSGTVSNKGVEKKDGQTEWPKGYSCIAEKRCIETIQTGQPYTDFMKFGDTIRIEMKGLDGRSIFGAIDQEIVSTAGRPKDAPVSLVKPQAGDEAPQVEEETPED